MPGIGRNLFSDKSATKKGVISIFDFDNPRLELSGITVQLCAEDDDLYSLVFDLSADSHGGQELAMNAMNASLCRGMETTGLPVTVQSITATCASCKKVTSWLTPRRPNTPTSWRPFNWFMET